MGITADEYAADIVKKVLGVSQLSGEHNKTVNEATEIIRQSWKQERAFLRRRIKQNIDSKNLSTVDGVKMIGIEDAKLAVDESR